MENPRAVNRFLAALVAALFVAVGAAVVVSFIRDRSGTPGEANSETAQEAVVTITKEQVIDLAKKEALKRNWSGIEVEDVTFTNGSWKVDLWHIPHQVGGFATVEITSAGKVKAYHPGE